MQLSPVHSSLLSALAAAGHEKTNEGGGVLRSATASTAPDAVQPETVDSSTIVSLSSEPPPPERSAPVYASLWLDGRKVGEVYTDGQASLPGLAGGMNLVNLGSGTALARQRAEEISRLTGAEVRYTDAAELQVERTREQLRSTYRAL